jgi:hypothetical protein
MTGEVCFICDVSITSVVMDLAHADTFILSIDGVDYVTLVSPGGLGQVFTPASPVNLTAGIHTFKVRSGTSTAQTWFYNATLSITGTDPGFGLVGAWQESTNNGPHWTINFDDGGTTLEGAGISPNTFSSGSFAAQSSSFTIDTDIYLYRWFSVGRVANSYSFWLDGNLIDGDSTALTGGLLMFTPRSPLFLAAGTHTFNLRPISSSRMYYRTTNGLIGSSHVTATSGWTEAAGTWPQFLMAFDASFVSPPAGSESGVVGFL